VAFIKIKKSTMTTHIGALNFSLFLHGTQKMFSPPPSKKLCANIECLYIGNFMADSSDISNKFSHDRLIFTCYPNWISVVQGPFLCVRKYRKNVAEGKLHPHFQQCSKRWLGVPAPADRECRWQRRGRAVDERVGC
jgi:hypothetical protein